MIAQDRHPKGVGWLTFQQFSLRLRSGEILQARGQVLTETPYELTITVLDVTHDAVRLSCRGQVGGTSITEQQLTLPLLGGPVVPLDITALGTASPVPSLAVAWEPSVEVAPNEVAVLIVGQWL
jgi:hypothetical protein